jgi:mRNA interferase MazF
VRTVEAWKTVLRGALREALLAGQAHAVAVMRETLAAIDNAEAADPSAAPPVQAGLIAGGVAGLGAGEVPRRLLSAEAVTAIVEREIQERGAAAATYLALGRHEEASKLRLQLDLLVSLLPSSRIDRGDLFWIGPDDARGPAPGYAHPHVVVQDDVFNHSRIPTVVVCALTTNLHRATEPGNVLLDAGEGNLPQQSVVVVSQISSIEKTRLGERIGSLSEARIEQILAGLRFQQTSFFRR